jgi:hypothetical protein
MRLAVLGLSVAFLCMLALIAADGVDAASTEQAANVRVKATQVGGTLEDFLSLCSSELHTPYLVDPPDGDRGLVALNLHLPPDRFRSAMVAAMKLSWEKKNDQEGGYRLRRLPVDVRARFAAKEAAESQARAALLSQLERVRAMAAMPSDRLDKLAATGDTRAAAMLHPRDRSLVQLAFALPKEMWNEFWTNGQSMAQFSALPDHLKDLGKAAAGDSFLGGEGLPSVRVSDGIAQGRISIRNGGTVDRPTIWVCLRYGQSGSNFNLLYAEGWTREPPQERRKRAKGHPSRTPDDVRFSQKITLSDKPRKSYFEPGVRPTEAYPLAEYLEQLADQVKVPIIAECDFQPKDKNWLYQQWWLAADIVERPLAETLDMLCADFEYEWQFKEGVLILRPKRWFLPPDQQGYQFPKWR